MSLSNILRRLDAIEAKLNINRTTGNWVRNHTGALVWDPYDLDAPPDHDPTPQILQQLATIRERMEARPGWTPPTEEQIEDGRRAFDEAIARIRAERQAVRDFTAYVEAELAAGKTLREIADPVRA